MKDSVLVTLFYSGYEEDYELPCLVSLSELYPRLLSALQRHNNQFDGIENLFLSINGKRLFNENRTLKDCGVVDGSKIQVITK